MPDRARKSFDHIALSHKRTAVSAEESAYANITFLAAERVFNENK